MTSRRRLFSLVAAASAALVLAACNNGGGGAKTDASADMSLGSADAPVTMIEYASPTCPGCAAWNREVFPGFKAKYVDTGKVRYVLREAMIHGAQDAAVFLVARCAGQDKYFSVIDNALRTFPEMQASGDARAWINRLGAGAGLSEERVSACVADPAAIEALNARFDAQMKEFDVQATPTFVINGRKLDTMAPPDLAGLSAVIDPLLKK